MNDKEVRLLATDKTGSLAELKSINISFSPLLESFNFILDSVKPQNPALNPQNPDGDHSKAGLTRTFNVQFCHSTPSKHRFYFFLNDYGKDQEVFAPKFECQNEPIFAYPVINNKALWLRLTSDKPYLRKQSYRVQEVKEIAIDNLIDKSVDTKTFEENFRQLMEFLKVFGKVNYRRFSDSTTRWRDSNPAKEHLLKNTPEVNDYFLVKHMIDNLFYTISEELQEFSSSEESKKVSPLESLVKIASPEELEKISVIEKDTLIASRIRDLIKESSNRKANGKSENDEILAEEEIKELDKFILFRTLEFVYNKSSKNEIDKIIEKQTKELEHTMSIPFFDWRAKDFLKDLNFIEPPKPYEPEEIFPEFIGKHNYALIKITDQLSILKKAVEACKSQSGLNQQKGTPTNAEQQIETAMDNGIARKQACDQLAALYQTANEKYRPIMNPPTEIDKNTSDIGKLFFVIKNIHETDERIQFKGKIYAPKLKELSEMICKFYKQNCDLAIKSLTQNLRNKSLKLENHLYELLSYLPLENLEQKLNEVEQQTNESDHDFDLLGRIKNLERDSKRRTTLLEHTTLYWYTWLMDLIALKQTTSQVLKILNNSKDSSELLISKILSGYLKLMSGNDKSPSLLRLFKNEKFYFDYKARNDEQMGVFMARDSNNPLDFTEVSNESHALDSKSNLSFFIFSEDGYSFYSDFSKTEPKKDLGTERQMRVEKLPGLRI